MSVSGMGLMTSHLNLTSLLILIKYFKTLDTQTVDSSGEIIQSYLSYQFVFLFI